MPYRVTLEDAKEALGITEEENEMNNMHYMQQKGSNGWGISENFPHIDPSTGKKNRRYKSGSFLLQI